MWSFYSLASHIATSCAVSTSLAVKQILFQWYTEERKLIHVVLTRAVKVLMVHEASDVSFDSRL